MGSNPAARISSVSWEAALHLRKSSWRTLLPGLTAVAILLASALLILTQLRHGALRGATFPLYITATEVRGVVRGSEVWISGLRAGTVERVKAIQLSETADPLLIEVSLLAEQRELIRRNSSARIRVGRRLVGAPVLELTPGDPNEPAVQPGDTLHGTAQLDLAPVMERARTALRQLPNMVADLRTIAQSGSVSARLLSDALDGAGNTGYGISQLVVQLDDFVNRLSSGTLALAASDSVLSGQVRLAFALADSAGGRLTAARSPGLAALADSTWARQVSALSEQLAAFIALADARYEDLTTTRSDSLVTLLAVLRSNIAQLRQEFRANPRRFIVF